MIKEQFFVVGQLILIYFRCFLKPIKICSPTLFSYECSCMPTYYGSACEILRRTQFDIFLVSLFLWYPNWSYISFTKAYHYYYTSRFIWATLGTILLLLLLCCLIGLCIYGCIAASSKLTPLGCLSGFGHATQLVNSLN
jgi:hypothetical protein